jgi:hypothetical protein
MSQLLHCTRHRSFWNIGLELDRRLSCALAGVQHTQGRLRKRLHLRYPSKTLHRSWSHWHSAAPCFTLLYTTLSLLFLLDLVSCRFVSLCLTLRSSGLHLLPFLECDCLYIFTLILSLLHFCCTSLLRAFYCEHLTDIYLYVCSHVRALHTSLHHT